MDYKQAFNLFNTIPKIDSNTDIRDDIDTECNHSIIIEYGRNICMKCGLEVEHKINIDDNWKIYSTESKSNNDPNRCYIRKVKDRTIYADVEHLDISDHIKDIGNDIYVQTCGKKVHRGAFRRAIVFASIFHAYKLDHRPQNCETLIKIFNIKRKDALKGLKFINEHAPADAPLRTIYITPEHLISEFMNKFNATAEQKKDVIEIYHQVQGQSKMLNRSRPQSVAAGIIYYYTQTSGRPIAIKEFIEKVNLSELTVNKISKEVHRILHS